jgi:hypothetical protein
MSRMDVAQGSTASRALAKRLLFTVTTGRSGTRHLAWALARFRDVEARHEPKPTFSSALRTVLARPATARQFWLEHKLPRIARSARPIYAETSHLACKGFLESLLDLGGRPTLIHLVRAPRDVSLSLWRLDTIPGRTLRGVKYYLGPDDAPRLPLPQHERLHDYQLCFWYCLEMAERAHAYRERWRELALPFVMIALADLSDPRGIAEIGRRLDLGELRPLAWIGRRDLARNAKESRKLERGLETGQLDALEAEVLELTGATALQP